MNLDWYTGPTAEESARLAAGVGRMIFEARTAAGFDTAASFGRASGVKPGTLRGIERGLSRPHLGTLARIAEGLYPGDQTAARAFTFRLAEAAGPSLAGDPNLPLSVSRELTVRVLGAAAARLGLDLDDDLVRRAVVDELRRATGELEAAEDVLPPVPLALEAGPVVRAPTHAVP